MGWFDTWIAEWRDTYEEYPVATVVTWGELLSALALVVLSVVYVSVSETAPNWVGAAYLAVGVAFAVWFTVVRRPVMNRLVTDGGDADEVE